MVDETAPIQNENEENLFTETPPQAVVYLNNLDNETGVEGEISEENAARFVDELIEIRATIKELRERREYIKLELECYYDATGEAQVDGSEYYALFDQSDVVRVPKPGSEQRDDLENTLVELGLWDEVTALCASRLKSKLNSAEWDNEQKETVNELMQCEAGFKVALRKIK